MGISEFQEWCVDDIFPYIRYRYMAKYFGKTNKTINSSWEEKKIKVNEQQAICYSNGAPNPKNTRNMCILLTHQVWSIYCLLAQGSSVCAPIYCTSARIKLFLIKFNHSLSLYLHLPSDISISPHLPQHLCLPHNLYLLFISISPLIKKREAHRSRMRIAYWHGKHLMFYLYLAETEIRWREDDGKIEK